MVRVISQETFDEVVKENINEFDMSPEEAVQDAVQQFEAQGVDLSNIVKEIIMDKIPDSSRSRLITSMENLEKLVKSSSGKENDIVRELLIVNEECEKSIAHRVFAGSRGAYNLLVDILELFQSDEKIASAALNSIIALMSENPDLLDKRGINVMISYLDNQENINIQKKVLVWAKICCIKHEQNRQDIFSMRILPRLKHILDAKASPELVRHVCGVARALVLDDDIRVQFGKAHDHARELAVETLCTLTDLLQKFKGDKATVSDIILTLSALIVRNEFCQKVEEAGGITFIMDVLVNYPDSEKLNRQCIKLVKGLAGNDDVKVHMIKNGVGPLIISAMHRHQESAGVVGSGCATIAALCLRCSSNSKALYDAGAPEVILQGMKIHLNDDSVQKQGSWAVRNMVSRDKSLCLGFLKLGAEDVLHVALEKHRAKCGYDIKAALRDLGCNDD